MKKLFLSILAVVSIGFLVGCSNANSPEIRSKNNASLSSDGLYIGKLKDGRTLYQYEISNGASGYTHYVYVLRDASGVESPEVNVNYPVPAGKTMRNTTVVLIDGVEYIKK